LLVEGPDDRGERLPIGVGLEDAQDGRRLRRFDLHPVTLGARAALLVHPHLADRHRPVSERPLADEEAAFLLAELASQRLLLEVSELKLVEDPADLDAERGLLVVAVEPSATETTLMPSKLSSARIDSIR